MAPSPRFIKLLQINLTYWQEQTAELTDTAISDLRVEHENLLKAVQMGLELEETEQPAIRLAVQLFPLIERGGSWQMWLPVLENAVAKTAVVDPRLACQLLNFWGRLLRLNNDYQSALAIHQEGLALAESIADQRAAAAAHLSVSIIYRYLHNYEKAAAHGKLAKQAYEQVGDERRVGTVLTSLGLVAQMRGDLETAVSYLQHAIIISRRHDSATLLARKLNNLASILHLHEAYDDGLQCCTEAEHLLADTTSSLDKIRVANNRGACHFGLGAYSHAEEAFRYALDLLANHPEPSELRALTLMNLGNALLEEGKLFEAASFLQQALPLWQKVKDDVYYANSLGTLGKVFAAQGDLEIACSLYRDAVAIFDKFSDNIWTERFRQEYMGYLEKSCADEQAK